MVLCRLVLDGNRALPKSRPYPPMVVPFNPCGGCYTGYTGYTGYTATSAVRFRHCLNRPRGVLHCYSTCTVIWSSPRMLPHLGCPMMSAHPNFEPR